MQGEWRDLFGRLNHTEGLIQSMEGESQRIQEEVRVTKEKWDNDMLTEMPKKKSCKKKTDKLRERRKSSTKTTCKHTIGSLTQKLPQGTEMQCKVQAESEKPMLGRMCQQRGAVQVAEACACLEPIKDF